MWALGNATQTSHFFQSAFGMVLVGKVLQLTVQEVVDITAPRPPNNQSHLIPTQGLLNMTNVSAPGPDPLWSAPANSGGSPSPDWPPIEAGAPSGHQEQELPAARWWMLVALGSLVALGPWTIDAYLPALPEMGVDLDASPAQLQLTLTSALFGLGLGQLLLGPLSDSFGRKRPLLLGILVHICASIAAAYAPTAEVLIALRFVQGVGCAAAAVIAMAIVRDLYDGARLASTLSRLMLITGVAPTIAPSFGAQLLQFTNWRGIFLALAGIGMLVSAVAILLISETLPPSGRHTFSVRTVMSTYKRHLSNTQFVAVVAVVAGCTAIMFTYIAGSPFVLQEQFGLSQRQYGWTFGGGAVVLTLAPQLNPALLRRYHPTAILLVLIPGAVGVSGVLSCLAWLQLLEAKTAVVLIWMVLGIVGCATPIGTALALTQVQGGAGSAAAVLGASRFALAAVCAPLVGLAMRFLDEAAAMGAVMALVAVSSLVVLWVAARHKRVGDSPPARATQARA